MKRRKKIGASELHALGRLLTSACDRRRAPTDQQCQSAACTEANSVKLPQKGELYKPPYAGRLIHSYIAGQETQTCQYRHSLDQPLVAHTGSATSSHHSLDAPVACKVSPNVQDRVGQIKGLGSEMKLSQDCLGMHQVHS
eukprot:4266514-Pleurochrysis_carterae.AAC.1